VADNAPSAPPDLDLGSAAMQSAPHAVLADLRRSAGPVLWSERHRAWLVLGHEAAAAAFKDDRLSSDRMESFARVSAAASGALDQVVELLAGWMVFRDPPAHERLRAPVAAAFTPRRVAGLEAVVRQATNDLLDQAAEAGTCDLRPVLAAPLPALVIARMLGVPGEDLARFRAWSDDLAGLIFAVEARPDAPGLVERSTAGARAMESYLTGLLEHYRRHPADNLLSSLGPLAGSTSGLSDREVAGAAMLLLFAGHETTATLIANSVWCLLGHPDQLRRVGSDPALWPSAIEELLRYEAPSKVMVRKVGAPTELAGRRLTPGQTVFVVIAAANRDDAVFPDPDDLDLGRHPNPHLAFGWGRHHCLGAALARLEARVCLSSLFARFPRLNTTSDAPDWAGGIIGRAVRAVPVSTT
jgi:cytochrome P450